MRDRDLVRWLLHLARPQRGRLIAAILLGAAAAAASVALMGTSAYLIARASQQPPVLTLTVAIVGVRFFGISRAVARYSERLVGHDAAFRVVADLRVAVYRRIEPLVPARVHERSSADLLTRFSSDVDTILDAYLRVFPPFAVAVVVGTGAVGVLTWIEPWVGLALSVGLLVNLLVVPKLVSMRVRHAQVGLASGRAAHSDQLLELLEVLPETWVADTSAVFVDRVRREREHLLQQELRVARGAGVGQAVEVLVAGVTVLVCLVLGVAAVRSGGLDGVLLAVLVLTPMAAFDLVAPLPEAVERWAGVAASTRRVLDLLEQDEQPTHPTAATEAVVPQGAAVRVQDVVVRWPGADEPTLHGVSLDIPDGARVALVGPSGSGKSTLAMTLAGFLDPEAGAVDLGGVPASELSALTRHATVGLLEQHPYLFDTSVGENLRLARPDATADELASALARVGLSPWLRRLPRGLDTPVGEHGQQLSGGQRQRLGLARLLLSAHPVVVLDEPDEHLDALTADALMADLLDAARGRTTVVISHRLTPLAGTDHILVLDEGRVVEEGAHGALVARGGWYARTWQREQEIAAASQPATT
jgi:ATP-binding cassette subfamily C protein CydCD